MRYIWARPAITCWLRGLMAFSAAALGACSFDTVTPLEFEGGGADSTLEFRLVPRPPELLDVLVVPGKPNTLVAVGFDGAIMRSLDAGQTWAMVKDSGTQFRLVNILAVPREPKTLVAVGDNGAIVRSLDAGATWAAVNDSGTNSSLSNVLAVPGEPKTLVAVGDNGAIVHSLDAGANWAAVQDSGTTFSLWAMRAVPGEPRTLVAVGDNGTIVRSLDAGANWAAVKSSGTEAYLWRILAVPSEPKMLVAVGGGGAIVRSLDAGATWATVKKDSGTESSLRSVLAVPGDPTTLVAVGENGAIMRSVDVGATWVAVKNSGTTSSLWAMRAVPGEPRTLVAVGSNGAIVRSVDAGANWDGVNWGTVKDSATTSGLESVTAVIGEPKTLVAVGEKGAIVRSLDAGATWAAVKNSGTRSSLSSVFAVPGEATTLVAVGEKGAIVRSLDAGATWAAVQNSREYWYWSGEPWLQSVTAVPGEPKTLVAVGENGAIVRSLDAGATWAMIWHSGTSSRLWTVLPVLGDRKALVAVGVDGAIVHSLDAGATWAAVKDSGTRMTLIDVVAVPGEPKALVAVGRDGTIVRSLDAGATWAAVKNSGTNSTLLKVLAVPGEPRTLIATGENGEIVRSLDAGLSWVSVGNSDTSSTLLTLVAVPGELKMLVAVGEDGAIVRSVDAGVNWAAVKAFDTRFTLSDVLAMPGEPKTLVAVGSRGAIARSEVTMSKLVLRLQVASARYGGIPPTHPALVLDFLGSVERLRIEGLSADDFKRLRSGEQMEPRVLDTSAIKLSEQSHCHRLVADLDPSFFSARAPDPLYVRVHVATDSYSRYYPSANGFFEIPNHPAPLWSSWLVSVVVGLSLVAALLLIMHFRPIAMLQLASQPAMWDEAPKSGIPGIGVFVTLLLSKLLLPLLLRQPRVLDAWIAAHLEVFHAAFEVAAAAAAERRSPYSALPFLGPEKQRVTPSPDSIRQLVGNSRCCLQIVAQGGAGKTRLALQLARWLFEGQVLPYPVAVLLIDEEFDDLWQLVQRRIKAIVGPHRAVPSEFIEALLRRGRLWIMVDRLSERKRTTQDAFARIYESISPRVVMCTARHEIPTQVIAPTVVRPLPLDKNTLLGFLSDQLQSEGAGALYPTLADQAALVQRLARQITLGDEELPVTPLLVRVFVSQAVELGQHTGRQAINNLPSNVPEAYFNYVERLDATRTYADGFQAVADAGTIARKAAVIVAFVELGEDFRPKPISKFLLREKLRDHCGVLGDIDFVERMTGSGLLVERRHGTDALVEFVLDPLAECLAAYEHAARCGTDPAKWALLLARVVDRAKSGSGFLLALHMNHAAYRQVKKFPEVKFPESNLQ